MAYIWVFSLFCKMFGNVNWCDTKAISVFKVSIHRWNFLAYQTNFSILTLPETSRSSWRTEQWSLHWSSKLCIRGTVHSWKLKLQKHLFIVWVLNVYLNIFPICLSCISQRSCFIYPTNLYNYLILLAMLNLAGRQI